MPASAVRAHGAAWAACGLIVALALLCNVARAEGLNAAAEGLNFDAAGFMRRLISGEALTSLVPIDALPGMLKAGVLRGLNGLTMNLGVNPLLQFGLEETRRQLCTNILNDLAVVNYVPFDSDTIGNPAFHSRYYR